MSSGHYQYACKHGQIVMLCKCIGPHEVRPVECPPSCPAYQPRHDIDTLAPVRDYEPRHSYRHDPSHVHYMTQASIGSRVFACSDCTRVYTRPMIGDPAPGRHRKVDA